MRGPMAGARPHRREGLLLAVAVGVVGVTFGVLADAAGFSLVQIVVLSALVFTGASQFAAVSVIGSGGTSAPRSVRRCCSRPATRCTGPWWPASFRRRDRPG
ncbi:MAG: AzlC family ABC transporter permease [Acidimicrobiales bacterium]